MVEVYLNLTESNLENLKKQAKEEAMSNDDKDGLTFPSCKLALDECYISDEGKLVFNGDLTFNGKDFGYIGLEDLEITPDLAQKIIETYVNKLNKIKTILEAAG